MQHFRQTQRETVGTDEDIAYFFDNKLKKWLIEHKAEVKELSKLNCERPFMSFITHYIFTEEKK